MKTLIKVNKYSNWYFSIIQNALKSNRTKKTDYFESHHIFPKSLGGTNDKSNLVLLTAREHFLCHLLLPKMMISPVNSGKMAYAFFRMKNKHLNSRLFDRFRKAYGKLTTGHNNRFYGKKHSPETLRKISRIGKTHSEESKKKMSASKKGKMTGKDNPMFGKTHPLAWRQEHSARLTGEKHFNYGKPAFNKGRVWINNLEISKMVTLNELPLLLNQGWICGRLRPQ